VGDTALPACCTPSPDACLAERLYCAYNAAGDPATAGRNYAGAPCPTWAELPPNVRTKWRAAARARVSHDSALVERFVPDLVASLDAMIEERVHAVLDGVEQTEAERQALGVAATVETLRTFERLVAARDAALDADEAAQEVPRG
jgi:hypothetical protein